MSIGLKIKLVICRLPIVIHQTTPCSLPIFNGPVKNYDVRRVFCKNFFTTRSANKEPIGSPEIKKTKGFFINNSSTPQINLTPFFFGTVQFLITKPIYSLFFFLEVNYSRCLYSVPGVQLTIFLPTLRNRSVSSDDPVPLISTTVRIVITPLLGLAALGCVQD